MTVHFLHHGGKSIKKPNAAMYPAHETTNDDDLRQSAHKEPVAFGNTRLLDFSSYDGRRQAGLQQYLQTHKISVGDEIVLCAMPGKSFFLGHAFEVEHPEEGVAFKIKTKYTGEELGELSLASISSGGKLLAEPKWLDKTDYIVLEVTAWPEGVLPKFGRFSVTPLMLVPKLGN